jgi:hypothetical protein
MSVGYKSSLIHLTEILPYNAEGLFVYLLVILIENESFLGIVSRTYARRHLTMIVQYLVLNVEGLFTFFVIFTLGGARFGSPVTKAG